MGKTDFLINGAGNNSIAVLGGGNLFFTHQDVYMGKYRGKLSHYDSNSRHNKKKYY